MAAVMGPSGSGKSTLLYAVSGMDSITAGTVDFCGKTLQNERKKLYFYMRHTAQDLWFLTLCCRNRTVLGADDYIEKPYDIDTSWQKSKGFSSATTPLTP